MKFQPIQTDNAIERVTFVCEFATPLEDRWLRGLYDMHGQFAEKLPKKAMNHGYSILVGTGPMQPQPVPGIASVTFEEYGRRGELLQAFHALPQAILYINQQYTRWVEISGMARTLLKAALQAVHGAQVQAFGLEYYDRFTAPASIAPPDVNGLLRKTSQYLVPRVFEIPGPWHSHHGSLRDDDSSPCPHSKNDNINIDLVREQTPADLYAVNLLLRHRRILAAPVSVGDASDLFDKFMDEMHGADKIVMQDLLTPEIAEAIGLGGSDATERPESGVVTTN